MTVKQPDQREKQPREYYIYITILTNIRYCELTDKFKNFRSRQRKKIEV